jgi:hypothetical protein
MLAFAGMMQGIADLHGAFCELWRGVRMLGSLYRFVRRGILSIPNGRVDNEMKMLQSLSWALLLRVHTGVQPSEFLALRLL